MWPNRVFSALVECRSFFLLYCSGIIILLQLGLLGGAGGGEASGETEEAGALRRLLIAKRPTKTTTTTTTIAVAMRYRSVPEGDEDDGDVDAEVDDDEDDVELPTVWILPSLFPKFAFPNWTSI